MEQYRVLHIPLLDPMRDEPVCRLLMTAPGVDPIAALTFVTTVDVPLRFAKSRAVGAHVGLTPQAVNPAKSSAVAGPRNAAKP